MNKWITNIIKILKYLVVQFFLIYSKIFKTKIVVCPFGIGDTLFVCMSIKAFKKLHKNVLIICKKYTLDICKSFDSINAIIASDMVCSAFNWYEANFKSNNMKEYIYAHDKRVNIKEYDSILQRYGNGILGIKGVFQFEYPKPYISDKICIDKPSIIIAPYAKSKTVQLSLDFWDEIVNYFISRGFRIFTNCSSVNEEIIRGTERLCVSVGDLFYLSEKCSAFIAYRSGICDWIALSDTNMYVINDPMWKNEWNLNNFSRRYVHYYQYNEGLQESIPIQIINDIEEVLI